MSTSKSEIGAVISALLAISKKKRAALTQILTICESQQALLAAEPSDEQAEFLTGLSIEKQALIDAVIEMDAVFQSVYKTIADNLEEHAARYMTAIKELQDEIKAVTRLDAKIRAAEEATRVFSASLGNKRKRPKAGASIGIGEVAEKYRAHANPQRIQ